MSNTRTGSITHAGPTSRTHEVINQAKPVVFAQQYIISQGPITIVVRTVLESG